MKFPCYLLLVSVLDRYVSFDKVLKTICTKLCTSFYRCFIAAIPRKGFVVQEQCEKAAYRVCI